MLPNFCSPERAASATPPWKCPRRNREYLSVLHSESLKKTSAYIYNAEMALWIYEYSWITLTGLTYVPIGSYGRS
jgi:hypothetical protein